MWFLQFKVSLACRAVFRRVGWVWTGGSLDRFVIALNIGRIRAKSGHFVVWREEKSKHSLICETADFSAA